MELLEHSCSAMKVMAALTLSNDHGFEGDYLTVWFEQTDQNVPANLSIQDNSIGNTRTFDLVWRRRGTPDIIFRGVGMLYGELLVGAYWGINQNAPGLAQE